MRSPVSPANMCTCPGARGQVQHVALGRWPAAVHPDDHRLALAVELGAAVDVGVGAELLDHLHLGGHAGALADHVHVLRPDTDRDRAGGADRVGRLPGHPQVGPAEVQRVPVHIGLQQVHRGRADEAGDEHVVRLVVHLPRRVALLQDAVLEHGDPVAHGHGLDLVVRDVHRGGAQPALQRGDLGARLHPQLGVQVGQRLVHAEHLRLPHDRPAHRHPLALATGERLRLAVQELLQVEDLGRFPDPLGDHVLGLAGDLEREAHVLADAHVRVERVVLEDHRDVAVLGRHVRHVPAADQDRALVDLLEAGEHAQRGGLPATRRPDQDEELPVLDLEVQRVDRGSLRAGVDAACMIIGHSSHAVLLPTGRNVPDDPSSKGDHRLS